MEYNAMFEFPKRLNGGHGDRVSTLQPSLGANEMNGSMFQIVCIEQSTKRPSTIATGFRYEIEARRTVEDWIDRRFVDAAYDHSKQCWWLLDGGQTYRITVENTSPAPPAVAQSRQNSLIGFGARGRSMAAFARVRWPSAILGENPTAFV